MEFLSTVAKRERIRLSERAIAGFSRAKAHGRIGGRPRTGHDPRKMQNLESLRAERRVDTADCRCTGVEPNYGGTLGQRPGSTGPLTRRPAFSVTSPPSRTVGAGTFFEERTSSS
jgi:hypothetical protein